MDKKSKYILIILYALVMYAMVVSIIAIAMFIKAGKKEVIWVIENTSEVSNEKDLYTYIVESGIRKPEIAYAISVLETGHFTSELCVKHNNYFGLYDSRNKRFHRFDSIKESVEAYRDLVERKWDGKQDYYQFLSELPYATDEDYIEKVKRIVEREI